jgi:prolyl 4-hydroxylase
LGMHFSQLNLTTHAVYDTQLTSLQKYMNDASKFYIELYKSRVPDTDFWPKSYGFEEFRLKKYEPNGVDHFADHIDATNLTTSKRFLVFFWYLNDVETGGETEFLNTLDLKVKPKQGRLLMFPPLWTFPHRGCKPISGPKYILGSYLHFV